MNTKLAAAFFLSVLLLAGCATGKDYAYEPSQDTPPGPGLFSGNDGVFTIYSEQKAEAGKKDDGEKAQKSDQ